MVFSRIISQARTPLVRASNRKMATYAEKEKRVRELQKRFTVDDGVPVHLKGGKADKILYQATLGLCVLGLGLLFNNLYIMAFPKKPQ